MKRQLSTRKVCPRCDAVISGDTCIICGGKPNGDGDQRRVPICVRCGVPEGKTRWRCHPHICDACDEAEYQRDVDLLESLQSSRAPRNGSGQQANLEGAQKSGNVPGAVENPSTKQPKDPRVAEHANRFRARGLEARQARLLAEDLVRDPAHRQGCPICAGERDAHETPAPM